jgi:hypothetical protein
MRWTWCAALFALCCVMVSAGPGLAADRENDIERLEGVLGHDALAPQTGGDVGRLEAAVGHAPAYAQADATVRDATGAPAGWHTGDGGFYGSDESAPMRRPDDVRSGRVAGRGGYYSANEALRAGRASGDSRWFGPSDVREGMPRSSGDRYGSYRGYRDEGRYRDDRGYRDRYDDDGWWSRDYPRVEFRHIRPHIGIGFGVTPGGHGWIAPRLDFDGGIGLRLGPHSGIGWSWDLHIP